MIRNVVADALYLGVEPDHIRASLERIRDAVDRELERGSRLGPFADCPCLTCVVLRECGIDDADTHHPSTLREKTP